MHRTNYMQTVFKFVCHFSLFCFAETSVCFSVSAGKAQALFFLELPNIFLENLDFYVYYTSCSLNICLYRFYSYISWTFRWPTVMNCTVGLSFLYFFYLSVFLFPFLDFSDICNHFLLYCFFHTFVLGVVLSYILVFFLFWMVYQHQDQGVVPGNRK